LPIGGRAADDLEPVAGRGLVFERFFEVTRASLQFTEQPRVLARDDRLRGEILQQRDLFFAEWPYFLAVQRNRPQRCGILAQRFDHNTARAGQFDNGPSQRIPSEIGRAFCQIGQREAVFSPHHSSGTGSGAGMKRVTAELSVGLGCAVERSCHREVVRKAPKNAKACLTEARRPFKHRIEHRREIAGRRIDDLQYFGGRGLLLERTRQFNGALLQCRFAIGNACDENPCRRRDFSDLVGSPSGHFGRPPFDLRAHVLLISA
jgi:hypothetical protein